MKNQNGRKKHIWLWILGGILLILAAFALLIYFAFSGSLIKKMQLKAKVKTYVAQNFTDANLKVTDSIYDFKMNKYLCQVESDISEDTRFLVWENEEGFQTDYETRVTNKENTLWRLGRELEEYADANLLPHIEGRNDLFYCDFVVPEGDTHDCLTLDMAFDENNLPYPVAMTVWLETKYEEPSEEELQERLVEMKEVAETYLPAISQISVTVRDKFVQGEGGLQPQSYDKDVTAYDVPIDSIGQPIETSVQEVLSAHGLRAGVCVAPYTFNNAKQDKLFVTHFNSATMENAMKPESILNRESCQAAGDIVVEWNDDVYETLAWAKENGFAMRGHTLIWYSQTPDWIFYEDFDNSKALVDRETMLARMESLIRGNFEALKESGYEDMFYAYDIVNEGLMEDGTLRDNLWKQTIGDDYIKQAFLIADACAPESIDLYYNDYNEQYKTEALVELAASLKDDSGRSLIDGIGLQGHLYTSDSLDQYFEMLDALSKTDLKIEITELDVCLGKWQNPEKADEEHLKEQGRFYYELVNGILERVDAGTLNMDAITIWGLADRLSWRQEYSPLLFDRTMREKYAYYGMVQQKAAAGYDEE